MISMLNSHRLSSAARCLRRPRSAITQAAAAPSTLPLREFQTAASLPSNAWSLSSLAASLDEYNDKFNPHLDNYHHRYHALQQVRWKRKSGASGDNAKIRRPSKAQKKRFRKEKERERDLEKHAAPGSKAGPRREFHKEFNQNLVDEYQARLDYGPDHYALQKGLPSGSTSPLQDPSLEYTQDDALLDDLMGNSGKQWTSQPTPEPVYYGSRQRQFYNRVADQMEVYRRELEALPPGRPAPAYLLPTDQEIAGALKAYRDQQGTRSRPIGIAKALQHVLQDMGIPSTSVFKEYTFNALLSCCRTPKEGIRVFELMQKQRHEISAYSWAILVDIHAKVGDFEGAVRALDEMRAEGHPPNLAAYTSLLAACYKVCNDGRIAHSVRAKAGKVGWEKWQDLRIRGLDPDAMAYGAMLRLCAARGLPEKAYGLIEEMPRFEVQPTTLCFTSALKAVAKSHETAIRYERGWSTKNKRRERLAAHHGKLARNIVHRAEQAGVEIDEGFVAALQLCAAAAGDSATAKAIYLAHNVRENMKHLRQIGDDAHLARLRGEQPDSQRVLVADSSSTLALQSGGGANGGSAVVHKHSKKRRPLTFMEREYGQNDTRTLSAILRACAQASDSNGVGKMWSGRENDGYLDLDSLRLIQQYRQPQMRNTDIPGMSRLEVGMGALVNLEDMENPRKRNDPLLRKGARKKFPGVATLDEAGQGLDDLPGDMDSIFFEEDGMLKQKFIDSGLYPEYERFQENERYLEAKAIAETERLEQLASGTGDVEQIEAGKELVLDNTPMYFCNDDMRWKAGYQEKKSPNLASAKIGKVRVTASETKAEDDVEWYFDSDVMKWATRLKGTAQPADESNMSANEPNPDLNSEDSIEEGSEEEWFFDNDVMRWKTRPKELERTEPKLTEFEARALEEARQKPIEYQDIPGGEEAEGFATNTDGTFVDLEEEDGFQTFFNHLQAEVEESEEDMNIDESEARDLYMMMKSEYSEAGDLEDLTSMNADANSVATQDTQEADNDAIPTLARGRAGSKEFGEIMNDLKDEWGDDGVDIDDHDWDEDEELDETNTDMLSVSKSDGMVVPSDAQRNTRTKVMEAEREIDIEHEGGALTTQNAESFLQELKQDTLPDALDDDFELEELMQLLPGLPLSRLRKVKQAYRDSLSDPSILTLVPLLRERMPDWYTTNSIRKANVRSAEFVMEKAAKAGIVDLHLLNGMLQVQCSAGSLNKALALYDQFEEHKLKPTVYSNRLVVQMFLKQKRLERCLEFKQRVEAGGQTLDVLSYGSLIAHCSKHKQLGSALMLLKECISVTGAPPGESYLKQLRILCRQEGLEEKLNLEGMIGKDPIEWLRHGEAVLKREYSKRGNRDILLVNNAMVRG